MQRFFKKNWKQNKLPQLDGLIISSLLSIRSPYYGVFKFKLVTIQFLLVVSVIQTYQLEENPGLSGKNVCATWLIQN